MLDYIENLRKKPEATRRRVLYISVAAIMTVIISIWALTLPMRFSADAQPAENEPSPFMVVQEYTQTWNSDFKRGLHRIREMF